MLKKAGPIEEPYGTPDMMFLGGWLSLWRSDWTCKTDLGRLMGRGNEVSIPSRKESCARPCQRLSQVLVT